MYTQTGRLLSIATPLGPDALLLEALEGEERVSRPFEFELSLLALEDDLDPRQLIGHPVAVQLHSDDGPGRTFHGRVASVARGGFDDRGLRRYRAVVRPWLWFLSKRKDCRIFQDRDVVEIVTRVFEEAGLGDFETDHVTRSYPRLEYCVQYNESDLDFVHRLLEEFGIYYYFRHEGDRHVLVLGDGPAGYDVCEPERIEYYAGGGRANTVDTWEHHFEFVSGRWSHTDYNFKSPGVRLFGQSPTVIDLPGIPALEQYEYPGRHLDPDQGTDKARVHMEAEEAGHETVRASGTCAGLVVGGTFELADHDLEHDGRFLVTALRHSAREGSYASGRTSGTGYRNRFECIPAGVIFKPRRTTPKPRVHGPQTAVVVGPTGEEIYTDEYGRVRVRFHWDRSDMPDESRSCWIRVAQPWAGANFGGLVLPRVGHEVVVEFLDGDPDRPLINGSVFNAANLPPQSLPAERSKMTIRSNSLGGSGGSNEITMNDTGGEEGFFVHAQYDLEEVVEHDRTSSVGNDQTISIGNDQSSSIGNNRTTKIATNDATDVGSSSVESVAVDKAIKAGSNIVIDAGSTLTLKCGAASISMTAAGIVNITGTMVNMTGTTNANVSAPITNLTGAALLNASGGVALVNGVVTRLTGGTLMHIGGSKVESVASGENLVQGSTVKLN